MDKLHTTKAVSPDFKARRRLIASFLTLPAASLLPNFAQGQTSNKVLRLIVPYAAGGSSDYAGRLTAQYLTGPLGATVVVENKPGANSIIAAQYVAQSPADGTIALIAGTAATTSNPFLYKKLPYDTEKAFAPIGMISRMPFVVVVNSTSPAKTIGEFLSVAKKAKTPLNYGSAGNGNPTHLAGALFAQITGIELQQIPYQGSAPSMTALLSGETSASFEVLQTVLPMVRAGRLKILAVMANERHPKIPDVPTLAELGFQGLDVSTSFAMLVPSATPAATQSRLREALAAATTNPNFIKSLDEQALQSYPVMTQAETTALFAKERARWKSVIERNSIKLD